VRFEAPSTPTNISASRISPVSESTIPDPPAEVIHERFLAGDMVLAHRRCESAEQLTL
jgi:hypothetical protein